MAIFDTAIFDPDIFDTGASMPVIYDLTPTQQTATQKHKLANPALLVALKMYLEAKTNGVKQ